MRDIVVAHPGVQHSADLAAAFKRSGRLAFLATRLQVGLEPKWPWASRRAQLMLQRRTTMELQDSQIQRIGWAEELLLRGPARGLLPKKTQAAFDELSVQFFSHRLLRRLDARHRVVIGTDTVSHHLFDRLRQERPDVLRVLDISHPLDSVVQDLIAQDARAFGLALQGYDDYHGGRTLNYGRELELADLIIVASRFTARSLEMRGVDMQKVVVIPYGVRQQDSSSKPTAAAGTPLRLLALGAMSERKGVTLLLRAMAELESEAIPVHLVLAGKEAGNFQLPATLPGNVTLIRSPDRQRVHDLYHEADALVLPSMCEGFGRTILEAMSHGCSVIATETSAAPDIMAEHPYAPITIVPSEGRGELSSFVAGYVERRAEYLRPSDARRTSAAYTRERYERSLVDAIDDALAIRGAHCEREI